MISYQVNNIKGREYLVAWSHKKDSQPKAKSCRGDKQGLLQGQTFANRTAKTDKKERAQTKRHMLHQVRMCLYT